MAPGWDGDGDLDAGPQRLHSELTGLASLSAAASILFVSVSAGSWPPPQPAHPIITPLLPDPAGPRT